MTAGFSGPRSHLHLLLVPHSLEDNFSPQSRKPRVACSSWERWGIWSRLIQGLVEVLRFPELVSRHRNVGLPPSPPPTPPPTPRPAPWLGDVGSAAKQCCGDPAQFQAQQHASGRESPIRGLQPVAVDGTPPSSPPIPPIWGREIIPSYPTHLAAGDRLTFLGILDLVWDSQLGRAQKGVFPVGGRLLFFPASLYTLPSVESLSWRSSLSKPRFPGCCANNKPCGRRFHPS